MEQTEIEGSQPEQVEAEVATTSADVGHHRSRAGGRSYDAAGSGGPSLRRLYTVPERMTLEQRDELARQEFEAAISPVTDLLRMAVPDAGSTEEAARLLQERQGQLLVDPNPGSEIVGDAYEADRRVYHRLLQRGYEANPRPRFRRKSHRLADRPQLLPGTRGW